MIRIFMNGYSQNKGGVETYISNLCNSLDHDAFEIIYSMPEMNIDGKIWKAPVNRHNYIKYCNFWNRFFKENHFDVLYDNECDIVSIDKLKFAKRARIPIRILHSHSTGIQQKMNIFHRLLEKTHRYFTIDKYVTHYFACSKSAGDWMFNGRTYKIIKNGIDLNKYAFNEIYRSKTRAEYHVENYKIIGFVGRLENEKNPWYSLEIIEEVIRKQKETKLFLIGDGSLKKELIEIAHKKGISENVVFLGAIDDVYKWYSVFDCLIMPSRFEGLPFVLVEAQAAGLPCVVSSNVSKEADLTGLVEFLSLDEPVQVWCEAVLRACEKERIDTRKQLINGGYSIEKTAEEVSSIIQSVFYK